jgi:lysylphosphatidylglycerol synthetase-like protein (DUF2156 family)
MSEPADLSKTGFDWRPDGYNSSEERGLLMLVLLALLLVLLFVGLGFAVHLLWIAAVILFVLWLVGFALGRGESAGRHRFYRW